jgi:hypothetical protein
MKIRIEKKNPTQYLIYFGGENKVDAFYISAADLAKLKTNVVEILEFPNQQSAGDVI